jgi:cytidine deaminase
MLNHHPSGLTHGEIAELRAAAVRVAENSYSPYSRFRVGAAILLTDGSVVTGVNVENASYRLTTCAEQTAIASAVAAKGPGIRLKAVAVANLNGAASMPCGACRQTILEFAAQDVYVFYPGEAGADAEATVAGLLPAAFTLEHLAGAE